MDIPVLIEPIADIGFRATTGEPLHLASEAPTREEAVAKLRELLKLRIAAGAQVVALAIQPPDHPLARFAGMLKDDPFLEPLKQAIAEYRDERDADAGDP
jgi:hypothetical protein